ncbi:MAG: FAD-binding protein [Bacteroidales bacterium]|nr:FAD-binding protein [Bacteroidales bacterium]
MREVEVVFNAIKPPREEELLSAAARKAGLTPKQVTSHQVVKRSLDARGSSVQYRYRVQVAAKGEEQVQKYELAPYLNVSDAPQEKSVVIVGAGPAGLFAALSLLQHGLKPIILERGKDVHARKFDMAKLSKEGVVDPNSNYCFGEGGAGTFSDGKLYTRSNKRGDIRKVLHQFVQFGADSSILIESHAHIGSDRLPRIIEAMRNCIIEHGGEVHFNTRAVDFVRGEEGNWSVICERIASAESQMSDSRDDAVAGSSKEMISFEAPNIILATGHSARDVYELFNSKGWDIEAKGFALGVRAEHPQQLINNIQYRGKYHPSLPAAEYSLVCQVDGRGVFSFCMCPGGILVPSATGPGEGVLNGMSNSMRNSKWANAGIVVSVNPEDVPEYASYGPLQLLRFQQDVERKMFEHTGSIKAPAQRMNDFVKGKLSADLPKTSYVPGAVSAPLHELLPPFVADRLRKAFLEFNKKMHGYYTSDALLLGVESRTSSPVRIPRDAETMQHVSLKGVYPCGEGAGYSGGIVSSALDGINAAEKIAASV